MTLGKYRGQLEPERASGTLMIMIFDEVPPT